MLLCCRCNRWFHQRCVSSLQYPLYAGDKWVLRDNSLVFWTSFFVQSLVSFVQFTGHTSVFCTVVYLVLYNIIDQTVISDNKYRLQSTYLLWFELSPYPTYFRLYIFACAHCNSGVEYLRRLELCWLDLAHLALYNLTAYNAPNYFDLDTVIMPYIMDNWHALQLPETVFFFVYFKYNSLLISNKTYFVAAESTEN